MKNEFGEKFEIGETVFKGNAHGGSIGVITGFTKNGRVKIDYVTGTHGQPLVSDLTHFPRQQYEYYQHVLKAKVAARDTGLSPYHHREKFRRFVNGYLEFDGLPPYYD